MPRHVGSYSGWVTIVGDPAPFGSGLRVTVEIGGERFDAWAYGSPRRRLVDRQAGEMVYVQGRRRLMVSNARRAQIRHVVGQFDLDVVGDWREGSPLYRTSSRVRTALRRAAESTMGGDDAALFTGLVIGDDAREPVDMVDAFRASGLSHLTAVSGENVAFVLAAASPLLRRLRPWWRWAATLGLIGWFMTLTRFEPSVLRAGIMAMLAMLVVRARPSTASRAPAGVDRRRSWSWSTRCWCGRSGSGCRQARPPACASSPRCWPTDCPARIGCASRCRSHSAPSSGWSLPSWLVFHRLPLVSLPANLLAVPVAGFVMLFGIPAGLVVGCRAAARTPGHGAVRGRDAMGRHRRLPRCRHRAVAAVERGGLGCCGDRGILALVIRHRWRRPPDDVPI